MSQSEGKSFAIWLKIPHFSSLRTFRQVLNLGLLTQSHKIGLEGIFSATAALPSTLNPTWIEEKRPKSGFSTSIILHSRVVVVTLVLPTIGLAPNRVSNPGFADPESPGFTAFSETRKPGFH